MNKDTSNNWDSKNAYTSSNSASNSVGSNGSNSVGSSGSSSMGSTGTSSMGSTGSSSGKATTPNSSIHCTVTNCANHCQNQQYCGLNAVQIGTHEANPTQDKCVDCQSFKLS